MALLSLVTACLSLAIWAGMRGVLRWSDNNSPVAINAVLSSAGSGDVVTRPVLAGGAMSSSRATISITQSSRTKSNTSLIAPWLAVERNSMSKPR
ncbi:hypothetical protein D3C78_1120980 [compost metagenome]